LVLRIAVGVILPLISDATEEVVAVGVVLPLGANEDGVVLPELMPLVVELGENIFFFLFHLRDASSAGMRSREKSRVIKA
jgi:hypothetical protein